MLSTWCDKNMLKFGGKFDAYNISYFGKGIWNFLQLIDCLFSICYFQLIGCFRSGSTLLDTVWVCVWGGNLLPRPGARSKHLFVSLGVVWGEGRSLLRRHIHRNWYKFFENAWENILREYLYNNKNGLRREEWIRAGWRYKAFISPLLRRTDGTQATPTSPWRHHDRVDRRDRTNGQD